MKTLFFGGLFVVFSTTYLERVETLEHRLHEVPPHHSVTKLIDPQAEEVRRKIIARLNEI